MHHLFIFSLALGLAWLLRVSWQWFPGRSIQDGIRSVILLVVPSLFVLMTAISIIVMGPSGYAMPYWQGVFSHLVATVFIVYACVRGWQLLNRNVQVMRFLKTLPIQEITGSQFRFLDSSELFIARCGIIQSELVISQGILGNCSREQIEAMLAHEQAHLVYQDVFWSALIHWLKDLLPFFPCGEELWKYAVLMRELRADRWASEIVDPLVLADSLLKVAQSKGPFFIKDAVALSGHDAAFGLDIRVKALINPSLIPQKMQWYGLWLWLILACCPLLLVPFHH